MSRRLLTPSVWLMYGTPGERGCSRLEVKSNNHQMIMWLISSCLLLLEQEKRETVCPACLPPEQIGPCPNKASACSVGCVPTDRGDLSIYMMQTLGLLSHTYRLPALRMTRVEIFPNVLIGLCNWYIDIYSFIWCSIGEDISSGSYSTTGLYYNWTCQIYI